MEQIANKQVEQVPIWNLVIKILTIDVPSFSSIF